MTHVLYNYNNIATRYQKLLTGFSGKQVISMSSKQLVSASYLKLQLNLKVNPTLIQSKKVLMFNMGKRLQKLHHFTL
jgi:hypothetical protein